MDENPPVARVERISRINYPSCGGVNHGQAPHAHIDVLIADAPVKPIDDRLEAVFACSYFLVGANKALGADV